MPALPHHRSSDPSGSSLSLCCPRVGRQTIHLAATAPESLTGQPSRGWLRYWSTAAPRRGSLMRDLLCYYAA
jgi:hypothetical protein